MGKGYLRRIKLARMATQAQEMQKALADPEGAFQKLAKPLFADLEAARFQQNRLSALVCALIDRAGGQVVVKRKETEKFGGQRVNIFHQTSDADDGTDPEVDITFTYELTPIPVPGPSVLQRADVPEPGEAAEFETLGEITSVEMTVAEPPPSKEPPPTGN